MLWLLLPLLKKRDTYYVTTLIALAFALWWTHGRLREARASLARAPRVEIRTVTKVVTKTVQGPVRVVKGPERIVEKLLEGKVVERVVYRDPVTTEKGAITIDTAGGVESTEIRTPACPPQDFNLDQFPGGRRLALPRYVGVGVNPWRWGRPRLRAGLTVLSRVDLGVAYDTRFSPLNGAFQLEGAYRF